VGVEVEDRFVANHLQGKTARGRDPFGREMSNPSANPEGEDYSTSREGGGSQAFLWMGTNGGGLLLWPLHWENQRKLLIISLGNFARMSAGALCEGCQMFRFPCCISLRSMLGETCVVCSNLYHRDVSCRTQSEVKSELRKIIHVLKVGWSSHAKP
jgi:hypothetical protein